MFLFLIFFIQNKYNLGDCPAAILNYYKQKIIIFILMFRKRSLIILEHQKISFRFDKISF